MIELETLRCPETHQALKVMSAQRLRAVNAKRREAGKPLIEGGYETLGKTFVYPTRNGVISFLLSDRIQLK